MEGAHKLPFAQFPHSFSIAGIYHQHLQYLVQIPPFSRDVEIAQGL